uniref:TMC domain-containing protein n=3 Tax=Lotharella globosa TaxID=91324 RepID=A0A7S4DPD9_9EUKA
MLEEDELADSIASRTSWEKFWLTARKVVGFVLNVLVILVSSLIVIGVYYYKNAIVTFVPKDYEIFGELVAPTVLSFVKAVFPMLTIIITEFEMHDEAGVLLQHQMWRLFAGKQTFVIALVAVNFNSVITGNDFDDQTYVCQEDEVGSVLFNAALIEFFTSKMALLATYYLKELFKSEACGCCKNCCGSMLDHEEFRASEGIVDLMYFQSLVWTSIPLFPFGGILCSLFLFFNFKFEKVTLTTLRGAPRATKNLGMVFVTFLVFSVTSVTFIFFWFMHTRWRCEHTSVDDQNQKQTQQLGMFQDLSPSELIFEKLNQAKVGFITWATPYVFFSIAFLVMYFMKRNEKHGQEEKFEEVHKADTKEIAALRKKLKRQAITLDVLSKNHKDLKRTEAKMEETKKWKAERIATLRKRAEQLKNKMP